MNEHTVLLQAELDQKNGELKGLKQEKDLLEVRIAETEKGIKALESQISYELYGVRFGEPILITSEIIAEFHRRGWGKSSIETYPYGSIFVVRGMSSNSDLYIANEQGGTSVQSELVKAARAAYLEKYA